MDDSAPRRSSATERRPSPKPPPPSVDLVCPACGAAVEQVKCKVVCPRCRLVVLNCSEF